jgi:RhtB (resistance to homoserine/threonine) family protein
MVDQVVNEVAGFVVVAAVVIVTPGQDTALTIRNTLLGGRTAGIATAAGVSIGQLMWAVATSLGIAALLQASSVAFEILRIAGAAYLIYLGAQALRAALRPDASTLADHAARGSAGTSSRAFRQGVLSNLGNPKMAVFFPSLLPQFVDPQHFAVQALALGALFALMTVSWLTAYAAVVARAGDLLRRTGVRRALEAATGAVLVGLGVRLAAENR